MRAVIDRFEDNYAVLIFGDNEVKVDLPRELLPDTAAEGDILNVSFEIDKGATGRQRNRIEDLLKKLKDKNR